jgi:hypothetical protein
VVRLDESTEVDVQQFNDQVVQLNVPQGSINFRLRRLGPDEAYQVTTPSGTVALTSPGRFRIDAGASGAPGAVTVFEGTAQLVGDNGGGMTIQGGQSSALVGNGQPPPPQAAAPQDIDAWSDQQEQQIAQAPPYVSPDMPGVDDLSGQGNWDRTPDYGPVWYPPVQVGWAPYRYGHWAFVPPWGWTWVDDSPWGFAPFHYGRWVEIRGRWGWIPGERVERPVYAPALVAFVGGGGLAVSIGVGPVVGWVPLGPREVYVPPYGGSITYIRNVNVTNVTNVNNITITNIQTYNSGGNAARFVNASAATVVRPEAMSSSRGIATAAVQVPPNALSTATVHNQPQVKPTSATVGAGPTVVKALGGNVSTGQPRPAAPGPQVQAKPLPAAMVKPLTTTPSATGGATAPGPKISTPTAGAGTGTNPNANINTTPGAGTPPGNKGPAAPGPNKQLAPAAGAGTGTNPNANINTTPGAGTPPGNKGPGAPGPSKPLTPAAGAGTGTNPNANINTRYRTEDDFKQQYDARRWLPAARQQGPWRPRSQQTSHAGGRRRNRHEPQCQHQYDPRPWHPAARQQGPWRARSQQTVQPDGRPGHRYEPQCQHQYDPWCWHPAARQQGPWLARSQQTAQPDGRPGHRHESERQYGQNDGGPRSRPEARHPGHGWPASGRRTDQPQRSQATPAIAAGRQQERERQRQAEVRSQS